METLQEIGIHSQDAVVIIDKVEGIVAFANKSAARMLGVKTGDGLGKFETLLESVAAQDREYVKNKCVLTREQVATTGVEFRVTNPKSMQFWLTCDAYQLSDKRYLYAIARDITKVKEHEEYLVEYGARKNTLLDTVMHQLNGSLNLMNNLALRAGKLNVATDKVALEDFISLVHNASKHCIDIIDNLLRKEHAESPGVHVKFSRTDVVKVVNYIFDELKKGGEKRSLIFETTDTSIFVNTDDMKLLQVVNNFASNAMKFTREGDEIRISVRETPFSVVVAVSDTGIGIPETLHPFVFEKHGAARRTGLNGEKSIGLGLSICNQLTTLIGGRMWFESKEGAGSTFFVEVPKE